MGPELSVVITTRDRPERLRRQLAALRAQTVADERLEVIVVDDGGGPAGADMLEEEVALGEGPALRVIRRDASGGPGAGRNSGWRAARGALIAFTDDDCEVTPAWAEAYLAAAQEHPGAFMQGRVLPLPAEEASFGPFSHTIRHESITRGFETANMLYPRNVLEQLGGFDELVFTKCGEDSDLAWRAIERGIEAVWVPDALAYHAVVDLGPVGMLRRAARWDEAPLAFKRHPGMRRSLIHRVFWSQEHWYAVRALVALLLPTRLWWLRWWLAAPYVAHLVERRSGPLLAPFIVLRHATEMAVLLRGSARYRTLVI